MLSSDVISHHARNPTFSGLHIRMDEGRGDGRSVCLSAAWSDVQRTFQTNPHEVKPHLMTCPSIRSCPHRARISSVVHKYNSYYYTCEADLISAGSRSPQAAADGSIPPDAVSGGQYKTVEKWSGTNHQQIVSVCLHRFWSL